MTAISLYEYLTAMVAKYRNNFDNLEPNERSMAQLNLTFSKPCQVYFYSFENNGQFMFVTFDTNKPDILEVKEHIESEPRNLMDELFSKYEMGKTVKMVLSKGKIRGGSWMALDDRASVYFFKDLQSEHPDPEEYAKSLVENIRASIRREMNYEKRNSEYGTIEEEIRAIKQDVRRINDTNLRMKMLDSAQKIDNAISSVKTLEAHGQRLDQIEQEIGGVRKLIGTTKEYQEFRVLATDVDDLKKSHVSKEVFDSEIKRLDQRIDSTKEIKFWSKRIVVDVILAVIATVSATIAALISAGII